MGFDTSAVEVRALAGCGGCNGCGGRCGLGFGAGRRVSFPRAAFSGPLAPGMRLRLLCEAQALRDRALVGYGLPLGMLVLAGMGGALLAEPLGLPRNPVVAFTAIAGTLFGLVASKKAVQRAASARLIEVRIEPDPQ